MVSVFLLGGCLCQVLHSNTKVSIVVVFLDMIQGRADVEVFFVNSGRSDGHCGI